MIEWWRRSVYKRVSRVEGFVRVLMKPRNAEPWTPEDRAFLRSEMRALARWIPAFFIFLLPGGMLLLPVYALLLDRRRVMALRLLDTNRKVAETGPDKTAPAEAAAKISGTASSGS